MTNLLMPSVSLPTGPYDWHPERNMRRLYDARVARLREIMASRGVTHVVVHGGILDHASLTWLTHFTPKLGPAYALIPEQGDLRLLFSGGPGMRSSAQRLTFIEDVISLRALSADLKRWLDETTSAGSARIGLVEGSAMAWNDWSAVQASASSGAVSLDAELAAEQVRDPDVDAIAGAQTILNTAERVLVKAAKPGGDVLACILVMERACYAAGAQDVRVRIARRAGGVPSTLPDTRTQFEGPTPMMVAVRFEGAWAQRRLTVCGRLDA